MRPGPAVSAPKPPWSHPLDHRRSHGKDVGGVQRLSRESPCSVPIEGSGIDAALLITVAAGLTDPHCVIRHA